LFVNITPKKGAKCASIIPHRRNQISLEKWIPVLEQGKDKINLEHRVPEYKKVKKDTISLI
uniref:Uncharacterized protein n=1 Tax=Prolemur simus TaxID=1328070 RepID=A0A8C8Z0E7_PROSS